MSITAQLQLSAGLLTDPEDGIAITNIIQR